MSILIILTSFASRFVMMGSPRKHGFVHNQEVQVRDPDLEINDPVQEKKTKKHELFLDQDVTWKLDRLFCPIKMINQ